VFHTKKNLKERLKESMDKTTLMPNEEAASGEEK
jgi:hypothetical protein